MSGFVCSKHNGIARAKVFTLCLDNIEEAKDEDDNNNLAESNTSQEWRGHSASADWRPALNVLQRMAIT